MNVNNKIINFGNYKQLFLYSLVDETIEQIGNEIKNILLGKNDDKNNKLIITKLNKSFNNLYLKGKGKITLEILFGKYSKYLNKIMVYNKNIKLIKTIEISRINKALINISNIILIDYINNKKHSNIQEYLKILIVFIKNNFIDLNDFFLILDLFLKSIINMVKLDNYDKKILYSFSKEPFLFINDIIEAIFKSPFNLVNDSKFTEEFMSLFNNFFILAKKNNILIENGVEWLKLFENKEINISYLSKKEYEKVILDKINDFFINIYKNHIPNFFFEKIYKICSMDLAFYLKIIKFLQKLYDVENNYFNKEKFIIKKGNYFIGKPKYYNNINVNTNKFSLILSFKIKEIKGEEDIIILNLIKGKTNIFGIIINKKRNLVISFKDTKLDTNLIIEKEIFYFLCIILYKNNKSIKIYINKEMASEKNILKEKIFSSCFCYNYSSAKFNYPHFSESMNVIIGDNYYGILGEIFLINIELDTKSVEHLFNSEEHYGDIIDNNKCKKNLIINKIYCSKKYNEAINHFKKLKYESLLKITQKSPYSKNNNNDLIEYDTKITVQEFINEKGIEFLIFMLHVINSQITDYQIFNLYISKTIEFLYNTIIYYEKLKVKKPYLEVDNEDLIKKTNIFILSLLFFLNNKERNKKFLSDDIKNSLINFLSIKFKNNNYHLNILANMILDYNLFNQNENNPELKELIIEKLDPLIINQGILFNIFLMDSIFLLKNVKHKKLLKFLESSFSSKCQNLVIKELVNYIINIKNEIKIYHYLKIIYKNLSIFIKQLDTNEKNKFLRFLEDNFQKLKNEHCKYCTYSIILCYLIKDELMKTDKNDNRFNYITSGYMSSPSFLFIRAIFIQIFKFDNDMKFVFIKCKNKSLYNMDFFDSMTINPIEVLEPDIFISRFHDIIKYFNYILGLKKTKIINNIIENFFNFIIEFLDKIINIKAMKDKKDILIFINRMFNSKGINNFFIIYLKYNEVKALKIINNYIKTSLSYFFKPFLYLISPTSEIGNSKKSKNIKNEIANNIIFEVTNNKEMQNINENLLLLLMVLYNNIHKSYLKISIEYSNSFINYCLIMLKQSIFLDRRPIDLNYLSIEKRKYFDDINEINNNNLLFISEIILDIIINLIFNNKNYDDKMLSLIIIKENKSIFYNNDVENLKKHTDNINNEKKYYPFFKKEINNFLFCLYYLIFFFNKFNLYKTNEDKKNIIDDILQILFNDLKRIYNDNKKITSIVKKIKCHGKRFELYNKMLSIYNKYHKESKFNLQLFYQKYSNLKSIKNEMKSNKYNDDSFIIIDNDNDSEYINPNKNNEKNIRSKSFNKAIASSIKERFLQGLNEDNTIFNLNFGNDNLNQTMISDLHLNLIDVVESADIRNSSLNEVLEKKTDIHNYLKKELSNFNQKVFYYKQIINEIGNPEDIKMMFNPKEYFIWKKFSISFKDLIFNNKKFKKISKAYEIYIRDKKDTTKKRENLYLNYPTKIRNYIIDDYYRPFLKPSLNLFNNKYINISHSYIKKNLLINSQFKEDNFLLIKFKRIFMKSTNEKEIISCQRIKNKGNIYGYINFNNNHMLFINTSDTNEDKLNDLKKRLEYIYSIKEDSIIDNNLYTLIFYKDIKEIIKRRFCFYYIGYEIFMKDNRSYLFNFFNKKNAFQFLKEIINHICENQAIKINKNHNNKNEEDLKTIINNIINDSNSKLNEYNIKIVEDPINEFKKNNFTNKYKRGELSNFNYLLLVNKFSSRTFNDNNQYLIFPLLFMEESRCKKRDLSKSICLNKDDKNDALERINNNKYYMGYYFTQHYSTSGYILFYLIRLNPFTYSLIELQSGKFDLPERIFSSMKNLLSFLNSIQENRELIPEFFYNYEFLINLNHNDLGKIKSKDKCYYINNFDTNRKDESYIAFIIYMRKIIELMEIPLWIDNIFGVYQLSNTDEHPNSYPLYSYESNCEFEKIKEKNIPINKKIKELEQKISILKLGISPAQIFSKPHPKIARNNNNEFENEINSFIKKEQKIIDIIEKYLNDRDNGKDYYLIKQTNYDDLELMVKFNKKIDILKIKLGESKFTKYSFKIDEQIEIDPHNNLICEIFSGIYCIVRNKDKTIIIISQNDIHEIYQWTRIVSAVTPFNKKEENKNIKKIIFGDEKGYINIMHLEYKLNQNDKYEEITAKVIKSFKAQRTLIKGIIHDNRLNIIISWSSEGVISINNDYSFYFLNIIDLGKNYDIKDIFISKFDLIYINCNDFKNQKNNIICYTLNGIISTCFEIPEKIVNFYYVEDKIIIINENRNIFIYDCYDLYNLKDNIFCDYCKNYKGNKVYIKYCSYYPKVRKLLIIFNNNKVQFQDLNTN